MENQENLRILQDTLRKGTDQTPVNYIVKKIRIATRNSPLALWQAKFVKKQLIQTHTNIEVELIGMQTEGDRFLESSLSNIGGKGLFVKELEQLLVNKKADIAIHSLKDMETELAKNTYICAVAKRESKHDVLVSEYKNIVSLPIKASIGTSSPRRKGFLKAFRPDLNIKQCRGNVETRLNKLKNGEFDGLILAEAGLKRLKIRYNNIISLDIFVKDIPTSLTNEKSFSQSFFL